MSYRRRHIEAQIAKLAKTFPVLPDVFASYLRTYVDRGAAVEGCELLGDNLIALPYDLS